MSKSETQRHVVTATEPVWLSMKHVPGEDGEALSIPGSRQPEKLIGTHVEESTYECSCGEELASWFEVQQHYLELTRGEYE